MKKQAIALLLAAVLVLSGCGRQQLPEETPADMGLAAVAAIEANFDLLVHQAYERQLEMEEVSAGW